MIPTFTKLLAMSNEAKSSSGCLSSFKILFSLCAVSCANPSVSFGESEKKADSALENRAESSNSNRIIPPRIRTVVSASIAKTDAGGGSAFIIKMEGNRQVDFLYLQLS